VFVLELVLELELVLVLVLVLVGVDCGVLGLLVFAMVGTVHCGIVVLVCFDLRGVMEYSKEKAKFARSLGESVVVAFVEQVGALVLLAVAQLAVQSVLGNGQRVKLRVCVLAGETVGEV
jgi:hypothetical protein